MCKKIMYLAQGLVMLTVNYLFAAPQEGDFRTKESYQKEQTMIINQLTKDFRTGVSDSFSAYMFVFGKLWNGSHSEPHWQYARQLELEVWIKAFMLRHQYYIKDFDYKLYPDKFGETERKLYQLSKKQSQTLNPKEKAGVKQYSYAKKRGWPYRRLYRFNRDLDSARRYWVIGFLSFIHSAYPSIRYKDTKNDKAKLTKMINALAQDKVVRSQLTQLIEQLQRCGYEAARKAAKNNQQCKV